MEIIAAIDLGASLLKIIYKKNNNQSILVKKPNILKTMLLEEDLLSEYKEWVVVDGTKYLVGDSAAAKSKHLLRPDKQELAEVQIVGVLASILEKETPTKTKLHILLPLEEQENLNLKNNYQTSKGKLILENIDIKILHEGEGILSELLKKRKDNFVLLVMGWRNISFYECKAGKLINQSIEKNGYSSVIKKLIGTKGLYAYDELISALSEKKYEKLNKKHQAMVLEYLSQVNNWVNEIVIDTSYQLIATGGTAFALQTYLSQIWPNYQIDPIKLPKYILKHPEGQRLTDVYYIFRELCAGYI